MDPLLEDFEAWNARVDKEVAREFAAEKIQQWWRAFRKPLDVTDHKLSTCTYLLTRCYYDMDEFGLKMYWYRQRRRVLDRYIEYATRPDHPATAYLAKRQILSLQ